MPLHGVLHTMSRLACLLVVVLLLSSSSLLVAALCTDQTSPATSAPVTFPGTYSGSLCADPQYWSFTLSATTGINYLALFAPPITSSGETVQPEINFFDSNLKPLFNRFLGCGRFAFCPFPNNGSITLAAGTWYIEVSRLALNLPGGEYPYTLQLAEEAPCVPDANEPSSEASPHVLNSLANPINGNICPTGEVDIYEFTINSLQKLTVSFSPVGLVSLRLLNSRGTFFPIDSSPTNIIVAPGTYRLNVTANPRVPNYSSSYTIGFTTDNAPCTEDAYEPNDVASAATAVTLPFEGDLTRCHWDDEDWFAFSLSNPEVLTVRLTGAANLGNQDLEIIYPASSPNNPQLLRILPIARQDPLTARFYLPAGSFLLRVPALRPTDTIVTFEYPTPVSYHLSLSSAPFHCPAGSFAPGFNSDDAPVVPINTVIHVCAEFGPAYELDEFFANQVWFRFTVTETSIVAYYIGLEYYDRKLYRVSDTGALLEWTPYELPPGEYRLRISIFGVAFWLAPNFDFRLFLEQGSSTTGNPSSGSGSFPQTQPPTPKPTTATPSTAPPTTETPTTKPPTTKPPTTKPPTTEPPTTSPETTKPPSYLILPTTTPPVRASRKNRTAVIVGGVVGVFAALALAGTAALIYRWRKHPERPFLPWQHGERPAINNNPAYVAPVGASNPLV